MQARSSGMLAYSPTSLTTHSMWRQNIPASTSHSMGGTRGKVATLRPQIRWKERTGLDETRSREDRLAFDFYLSHTRSHR